MPSRYDEIEGMFGPRKKPARRAPDGRSTGDLFPQETARRETDLAALDELLAMDPSLAGNPLYQHQRRIAAWGPEQAGKFLQQAETEEFARRTREANVRKAEVGVRKTELENIKAEHELEQLLSEGGETPMEELIKQKQLLPTEAQARVLQHFPELSAQMSRALGRPGPDKEAPIWQTPEGVWTNAPMPVNLEEMFRPVPETPAPAPRTTPPVSTPVAPDDPIAQMVEDADARAMEEIRLRSRVKEQEKSARLLKTAQTLTNTIFPIVEQVFEGNDPGLINRWGDWFEMNMLSAAQFDRTEEEIKKGLEFSRAQAIALYRSQVSAAATSLAKMAGEQRVSDADAARFLALMPDGGGWLFDLPDTAPVAKIKIDALKNMFGEAEKAAGMGVKFDFSGAIRTAVKEANTKLIAEGYAPVNIKPMSTYDEYMDALNDEDDEPPTAESFIGKYY